MLRDIGVGNSDNVTDAHPSGLYDLLANVTFPAGDAVANATRPSIELNCLPNELAKAVKLPALP